MTHPVSPGVPRGEHHCVRRAASPISRGIVAVLVADHTPSDRSEDTVAARDDQHGDRDGDQQQAERDGGVAVGFESEEDLQGERAGLAGDGRGELDGRSELAERTRPAEGCARHE